MAKTNYVFTNWDRSTTCSPEEYHEPSDVEELRKIVLDAGIRGKQVKVVGEGHSINGSTIACTDDYMVSMKNINRILEVDNDKCTVKVEAGILLSDLNSGLDKHGLSLSTMPVIGDVTLAGIISTGTHGTGTTHGTMSTYLLEISIMKRNGEIQNISHHDGDLFRAAVLNLGSFGIIVSVTMQCEPSFNICLKQYSIPFKEMCKEFETYFNRSEYTSLVVVPYTDYGVVMQRHKTKKTVNNQPSYFWDYIVRVHLIQLAYYMGAYFKSLVPLINKLIRYLYWGKPSEAIDKSYKILIQYVPDSWATEWAIPRKHTGDVIRELKSWIETSGFPAHFWILVRCGKQENVMLSPSYDRDVSYINPILIKSYGKAVVDHTEYEEVFQSIARKYQGRPHWAKNNKGDYTEKRSMYPELDNFLKLRREMDPDGMFLNRFLRCNFGIE